MKWNKRSPRLIYRKGYAQFLAWMDMSSEARVEIQQLIEYVIK